MQSCIISAVLVVVLASSSAGQCKLAVKYLDFCTCEELQILSLSPAPPDIIESPSDTDAVLGDEVQLFCEVSGAHPLNISWNNTFGVLDESLISTSQTSDNTSESELTITTLTAGDEGDYTCTASNDDGFAVSFVASLRLQGKEL